MRKDFSICIHDDETIKTRKKKGPNVYIFSRLEWKDVFFLFYLKTICVFRRNIYNIFCLNGT